MPASSKQLPGRVIYPGCVEGEAIVAQTSFPLSGRAFDFAAGRVSWAGHELDGEVVREKVLVVPEIRAFGGGDWALYSLGTLYKTGPAAILCGDIDSYIAAGAILGQIVTVALLPAAFLRSIQNGDLLRIDASAGEICIRARATGDAVFKISEPHERPEFELTTADEEMLGGAQGCATSECLEFLIRYGKAIGASRLISIASVHAAGSGYNTSGDAASAYLSRLADGGARARVPATLNPIALDPVRWNDVMQMPAELHAKQEGLNKTFARLGFSAIHSCAPYWTGHVPAPGSRIVWSEHNAVSFANSVLGARTNFESNIAVFPAALTGRIPEYGLYLSANRKPAVVVNVTARLTDAVDWRYLGVAAAQRCANKIPFLRGLRDVPTVHNLRDLCASFGPPWTASPMLHIEGVTPESADQDESHLATLECITIEDADLKRVRDELAGNEAPIDLVALGCPQYSLQEIGTVAAHLKDLKIKSGVRLWVWADAATRAAADRLGYVKTIADAGGEVLSDTCGCAACPIERSSHGFRHVATDSTKSYGFLRITRLQMHVGSLADCIEAATSGAWRGRTAQRA